MYIVFCGIIPVCAIIAIIVYYQRHNAIITWPKRSTGQKSYVSNLSRITDPIVSTFNDLTHARKNKRQQPPLGCEGNPVYSISTQVSNNIGSIRNLNLEIKPQQLISTTNTDVLNNFANCKSVSIKRTNEEKEQPIYENTSNIMKRKISFKNIKGLKLNTGLKFGAGGSNLISPGTSETLICSSPIQLQTTNNEIVASSISVKDITKKFQNNSK